MIHINRVRANWRILLQMIFVSSDFNKGEKCIFYWRLVAMVTFDICRNDSLEN